MDAYMTLILPLLSFVFTLVLMPFVIRKMLANGYTGTDVYKISKPKIAELGGIGIFAGVLVTVCVSAVFNGIFKPELFVPLLVVIAFFGFGLFDDLFGISGRGRYSGLRKVLMVALPFPLALPVVLVAQNYVDVPFDGGFYLDVFVFIVAPLYVVVTSNIVNIFSNFNGQSAGNVVLCLFFILLKLVIDGKADVELVLMFTGAVLAFLVFNWYPAKVFPGNCGDYMMGAMLGVLIVANGLYAFGMILLAPMILHFLLAVYWLVYKKKKYPHTKFGDVRSDGTIKVPHPYYFSWLFPYYFRLREEQIVLITMVLTACCGIIAVAVA